MYERKDEVRIKTKYLKKDYADKKNLRVVSESGKLGKCKTGRIIQVEGEFANVDFWDSVPTKFTVKLDHLELVKKADAEVKNLTGIGNIETQEQALAKSINKAASTFDKDHVPLETTKVTKEEWLNGTSSSILDRLTNNGISKKVDLIKEVADKVTNYSEKAARYNEGKLPMHLVPPDAMRAMAAVLDVGAKKYALRNWEKGADYSVPYASLMRHLLAFWDGEDNDPETKLPHLYHVIMNAAFLIRYYEQFPELDDRPKSSK